MKRSETRIALVTPVRVFGLDAQGRAFNDRALTIDVSLHGARIEGLNCSGLEGQTVGLRYGDEKARFRVLWVSKSGASAGRQVGLYCVEPGTYIWDVIPPEETQVCSGVQQSALQPRSALFQMESSAPSRDRRFEERFSIGGSAQVRNCHSHAADWAVLCDLSRNGCYLETRCPWPVATQVEMTLDVAGIQVQAKSQVITSHPLVGMGLRFLEISRLNQQRLDQILSALQQHCATQEARDRGTEQEPLDQQSVDQGAMVQQSELQEDGMSLANATALAQLIAYRPNNGE